jgi:predicted  nucleic acid-binding Zn-ribbon protein
MPAMHPQLEVLLQLQDLQAQRHELTEGSASRAFEEQEFGIEVDQALRQLDDKIDELRAELTAPIRARLQRVDGHGRAVVPLINGVCYGCFTSISTSSAAMFIGQTDVRMCENCGRFLYGTD